MNTIKQTLQTIALASLLAAGSGCIVAAVGAGIGAAKYGSAKQKEAYAKYRSEADKNNTEREKAGLTPTKILTYEEWRKGQENIEPKK